MAIDEKLIALNTAKQSIKTALVNKGVNVSDIPFTDYGSEVASLPSPKVEETKTITPNFASGNVVVTPTTNKVMTQVTINADANHTEANIKKGVVMFGKTGTYEGEGGGGGGVPVAVTYAVRGFKTSTTTSNLRWSCSSGLYNIQIFIDEEGNFYTPTQVKIYHNNVYKTYANVTSYLFGTATNTGTVTFKASHPVSGFSVPVGIIIVDLSYDEFGTHLNVGLNASVGFTSYQGAGHYTYEQIGTTMHTQAIPAAWFDAFIDMTNGYVSNYNEIYDGRLNDRAGINISFYDPD